MATLRGRSVDGKTVVKVTESTNITKELRRLERAYPEALAGAMFEEAAGIFNESQEEVPVDTGALRRSGLVFMRKMGWSYVVVIGYGTAYALRIHEDTKLDAGRQNRAELAMSNPGYKPKGAATGKSKYLEDPYLRAIPGLTTRLVSRTNARVMSRDKMLSGIKTIRGKGK